MKEKAYIYLENGYVFEGEAFGYLGETVGEVVFNTGMTGYQEVLTDPSYWGQMVVMTYPLMGNYGLNLDDHESDGVKVKAFIVRDKCDMPNNFRCEMDLDGFLKQHKIPAVSGIDTRALTKILRNKGTMNGVLSSRQLTKTEIYDRLRQYDNKDAVAHVSVREKYTIGTGAFHIALWDFGLKRSIIHSLTKRNCKVTVLPYDTRSEDILSGQYDGLFLSNGPGDPMDLPNVTEELKKILGHLPVAGICLGHQILSLAMGGKTEKLKFGHRGVNHPVKDVKKSRVIITSQNHGYYVSDIPENCEVTYFNINDNTVEGIRHKHYSVSSVQFHPEASPGPKDGDYIFDEFIEMFAKDKEKRVGKVKTCR